MELKNYQIDVMNDLKHFLQALVESKRLNLGYDRKNPRLLFSSRSTLTIHI